MQSDKYNKFAYSTNYGFDADSLKYSDQLRFGDNILAFSFDSGVNWQTRNRNTRVDINGNTLTAAWESGQQAVETQIEVLEDGTSIRKHVFVLDRPALVVDTGFAVDQWYEDAEISYPVSETPEMAHLLDIGAIAETAHVHAAMIIRGTNGMSGVRSLDAYPKLAKSRPRTHTNVSAPRTLVPFLLVELPAGRHTLIDKFGVSPRSAQDFVERFTAVVPG
ncbi:MAG: hypothetical protein P8Y58_16250 [Novosphingobium sp.]